MDGNGVERVVYAIESLIRNSKNIFLEKDNKTFEKGVVKCTFENSQSFLLARNSKEVREMSTNPNHIISWPEHLKWWLNSEIDKYLFIEI